MRLIALVTAGIAAATMITAPCTAQKLTTGATVQSDDHHQGRFVHFKGELIDVRTASLKAETDPHLLTRVELEDGRTVVMDFGSKAYLDEKDASLEPGQTITADGLAGRINDKPVVVVYSFRIDDGRQMFISHQSREQTRMTEMDEDARTAGRDELRSVEGELVNLQPRSIGDERHYFATIELKNGKTVLADLGPVSKLREEDLNLQRGRRFSGKGISGRMNEREILLVHEFRLDDGDTVRTPLASRDEAEDEATQEDQTYYGTTEPTYDQWEERRSISGKVEDMRTVMLPGTSERHFLLKIRSDEGETIVIDLGAPANIRGLNLRNGDTVLATGRGDHINGRPIFRANQIAEIITIEQRRKDEAEGPSEGQGESERSSSSESDDG